MAEKIVYQASFLDMLKDVSKINAGVLIEPDGDSVRISMCDTNESITYDLIAPIDYFNIPDDEIIAFGNVADFVSFVKSFIDPKKSSLPELFREDNKIIISSERAKLSYVTQDPVMVSDYNTDVTEFPDEIDFEFTLDAKTIGEIRKTKQMLGVDCVTIKTNSASDSAVIQIHNASESENSYELSFPMDNKTDSSDISFDIIASHIDMLPQKNFLVSINAEQSRIRFALIEEGEMSLCIYTAQKG